jgi:glycosyltransferase involved in cell wall biosynthesis
MLNQSTFNLPLQEIEKNIKVSISLVTFNHEQYIAQAIESILMQVVDFDYEIVIGEDYSTDKTREIVIEYYNKYPDKIRLILPEENLGCYGQKIFVQTLKACQGKYIALLDGDDYWTSANKLQTQVDFLDSHPDCAICFHDVVKVIENGSMESLKYNDFQPKAVSTIKNLLKSNFIPTCSTLYRNRLFPDFPDWYYDLICGDWILHVFNAQHGKIGYINQTMGAYRVHEYGLFSSMKNITKLQEVIKCYPYLNHYLNYQYNNLIESEIFYRYYQIAIAYQKEGDFVNARANFLKCVKGLLKPLIAIPSLIKLSRRIIINTVNAGKLRLNKV